MEPGESKTAEVAAADAYGLHYPEMVMSVPREQLPDDLDPEEGDQLELRRSDGRSFLVTVTDTSKDEVAIDTNHPLAGKDLTFEIELVQVE